MVRKILVAVIAVGLFSIAILLARSAPPVVEVPSSVTVLGQNTAIPVHVRDPHGVRRLAAFLEQNGARYGVWEAAQPATVTDGSWTAGAV